MKKWLCLLLATLMLFSVGCGKKDTSKKENASSTTTEKGALTKEDAIAAAEAYWGVKSGDIDPETGYRVSVVITAFPGECELDSFMVYNGNVAPAEGATSSDCYYDNIIIVTAK